MNLKPIDQCINKPFNESMRQSWQSWMREDRAKTKMGNLKQPTRQDAINWDSIKQETIVNSFLICGISNDLDDSEDDHVSDDQPVVELDSGTVGEESEEDEAEENDSDADADELGDPFSDDSDADFSLHVCLSQLFCVECFCNCCSYVNMHDLWKCPNCVHSTCPPPPPLPLGWM